MSCYNIQKDISRFEYTLYFEPQARLSTCARTFALGAIRVKFQVFPLRLKIRYIAATDHFIDPTT